MILPIIFVLLPLVHRVRAINNWDAPCIAGECTYDFPSTNTSGSGTLKIWGSDTAITDITNAAHWQILGCDSNAQSQNIRLVCMNDPEDEESHCGHLDKDVGAVGKVVRLPDECGPSGFARIAKSWIPDDQSIPTSVRRGLVRRDDRQPVVRALALDTDFDKVDWSKTGKVNFAIRAASIPGVPTEIKGSQTRRWSSRHTSPQRRIDIDLDPDLASFLDSLGKTPTGLDETLKAVKDAIANSPAFKDIADKVAQEQFPDRNKLDFAKQFSIPPATLSISNANLMNSPLTCGGSSPSVKVDIAANLNAQLNLAVSATGTFAPPHFDSFFMGIGMAAEIGGIMSLSADVIGDISTDTIQLGSVGIPALEVPGILKIEPSFSASAQVSGRIDTIMDVNLGFNMVAQKIEATFPPQSDHPPVVSFTAGDTPLVMNAVPGVASSGSVSAHITPTFNLAVTGFDGVATTQVSVGLGAGTSVVMHLNAQKAPATEVGTALLPTSTELAARFETRDDNAPAFDGCFNFDSLLAFGVDSKGDFGGLFSSDLHSEVQGTRFQILNKCFGSGQASSVKKRSSRRRRALAALKCPADGFTNKQQVTSGTVSAGDIKTFANI
ncbi:hypothetical protein R3P38DRAFT_3167478 [Favolaschia claudopus]|uniref:Uncharacterized protein n=1 Tax=Favolaschia claudopus TaxID=2862362 RepID=A0AAW0EGK0_9AGAR